jgi:hypothetical protein
LELDAIEIPRPALLRPYSLPILNFSLILESMNVMPHMLVLDEVFLSLSAPVSLSLLHIFCNEPLGSEMV